MKRIVFSGHLGKMYPDGILVEGDSAAECLAGLRFYPGFRADQGDRHTVVLPHFQSRDSLYEKTDREDIIVVPVVAAAGGKGGLFQIIIGALLVVTGIVLNNPFLVKAGAAMILSGVVQMLMPQPELQSESDSQRSLYLPAGRNTTKVGTRIPLLLGRRKVWGHILAFNVTATLMPPAEKPADFPDGGKNFTVDGLFDTTYHES